MSGTDERRLRSESGSSPDRIARITAAHARAQRERADMARDFRERLTHELAINGSASQAALVDAAVSAHLEIAVISAKFLRCCATCAEMERLQAARGQLQRTLRALGLVGDSGEPHVDDSAPPPGASDEERRAWSRKYVEGLMAKETSATR